MIKFIITKLKQLICTHNYVAVVHGMGRIEMHECTKCKKLKFVDIMSGFKK